ncbi:MAG: PEP-CTERM sorting domain-containing protein [Planctomycetaceae bacterium]|nr:PEP-CTERM sorting domain-containing protein [Planctomycetaceae bacterium]
MRSMMVRPTAWTLLALAGVLAMASAAEAAVIYNGQLSSTTQIITASNNPFFVKGQDDVAGVNFYDSYRNSSPSAGPVNGVGFDDVEFGRKTTNRVGPFNLSANGTGPVLTITWNISDFTERTLTGFAATGSAPDAANLTAVAKQIFYMNSGKSITMSFTNLAAAGGKLYVQVLGGDEGWSGTVAVESNGAAVGTWTNADGVTSTASLFAFDTTADASGGLTLKLTSNNNYTGISSIIISREIPEPATMCLLVLGGVAALVHRKRR